jgi:hypothetical protein
VDNHLRNHAKEEVLDQTEGETGLGPVVAPLEDLEHVGVELNLAIKVLLLESLEGDLLLAVVGIAVLVLVELEVVLNGLAGQLGLLVLAGSKLRGEPPEGTEDGQSKENSQEQPCLEALADAPCQVRGDTDEQRDEERVGEGVAAGALSRQRRIRNRRVLLRTACQLNWPTDGESMAGAVCAMAWRSSYIPQSS